MHGRQYSNRRGRNYQPVERRDIYIDAVCEEDNLAIGTFLGNKGILNRFEALETIHYALKNKYKKGAVVTERGSLGILGKRLRSFISLTDDIDNMAEQSISEHVGGLGDDIVDDEPEDVNRHTDRSPSPPSKSNVASSNTAGLSYVTDTSTRKAPEFPPPPKGPIIKKSTPSDKNKKKSTIKYQPSVGLPKPPTSSRRPEAAQYLQPVSVDTDSEDEDDEPQLEIPTSKSKKYSPVAEEDESCLDFITRYYNDLNPEIAPAIIDSYYDGNNSKIDEAIGRARRFPKEEYEKFIVAQLLSDHVQHLASFEEIRDNLRNVAQNMISLNDSVILMNTTIIKLKKDSKERALREKHLEERIVDLEALVQKTLEVSYGISSQVGHQNRISKKMSYQEPMLVPKRSIQRRSDQEKRNIPTLDDLDPEERRQGFGVISSSRTETKRSTVKVDHIARFSKKLPTADDYFKEPTSKDKGARIKRGNVVRRQEPDDDENTSESERRSSQEEGSEEELEQSGENFSPQPPDLGKKKYQGILKIEKKRAHVEQARRKYIPSEKAKKGAEMSVFVHIPNLYNYVDTNKISNYITKVLNEFQGYEIPRKEIKKVATHIKELFNKCHPLSEEEEGFFKYVSEQDHLVTLLKMIKESKETYSR